MTILLSWEINCSKLLPTLSWCSLVQGQCVLCDQCYGVVQQPVMGVCASSEAATAKGKIKWYKYYPKDSNLNWFWIAPIFILIDVAIYLIIFC